MSDDHEQTIEFLKKRVNALEGVLMSYIHENTHPDCLADMRYRVTLPNGFSAYFGRLEDAQQRVLGRGVPGK